MKKTNLIARIAGAGSTALAALSVGAANVLAQSDPSGLISGIGTSGNLLDFIRRALTLAITLSALVAVAYLIFSGVQYIIAAGDDSKIEKATKGITYSVVGLVVCFISALIVNYILTNLLK
jgi:hypothetical protein